MGTLYCCKLLLQKPLNTTPSVGMLLHNVSPGATTHNDYGTHEPPTTHLNN